MIKKKYLIRKRFNKKIVYLNIKKTGIYLISTAEWNNPLIRRLLREYDNSANASKTR